jgi:RHS repeat-associated protein
LAWAPFLFADGQAGTFVAPPAEAGYTATEYDILDRVVRVTNPNGTFRSYEYPVPWMKLAYDECWQPGQTDCTNSGPGKTVEIVDGLGRVLERQLWDGQTFKTKELYRYDILGRQLEAMQDDAVSGTGKPSTRRTSRYDSFGRKIEATDPDSGTGTAPGVWRYGYDLVGNLIFQDDPSTGQSLRFSYDRIDRLVVRREMATDSPSCLAGSAGCGVLREQRYRYDVPANHLLPNLCAGVCGLGDCGVGRLTATEEYVGSEQRSWDALCYDTRGRTRVSYQQVNARADLPALRSLRGKMQFQYDVTDWLWSVEYPDGEVVQYWYDYGWLRQLKGSAQGVEKLYLLDAKYDEFSRATLWKHGNDVDDVFVFGAKAENYRLTGLRVQLGSNQALLSLGYRYWADGLLGQITDNRYGSGVLSNAGVYRYDGLGHLLELSESRANGTYGVDGLRNLSVKEGMALTYGNTARPHQPTSVVGGVAGSGQTVAHDANGNRTRVGPWTYSYDPSGRLVGASSSSAVVQLVYGASGQRAATVRGAGSNALVSYAFGRWMDVGPGDQWTKYYYAGDRLLASQRVYRSWSFLYAAGEPWVEVAGVGPGQWGVQVAFGRGAATALSWGLVGLTIAALLLPQRRQRVVGVRPGAGETVLVLFAFLASSLPLPVMVRSAAAGGGGGGNPPPTPPPPQILHYHLDHLGSTQVLTREDGTVLRHIRYRPYGEVRGYFTATGSSTSGCEGDWYCREFTGYEKEPVTGLYLATARAYDPMLGMFLSHDPARQFPNPYAYGPWSPVNGVDPSGAIRGAILAVWGFIEANASWLIPVAIGVATAIDVGVRTGNVGAALGFGMLAGASSYLGGTILEAGLGLVAERYGALAAERVSTGLFVAGLPTGAYGVAQAAENGMYATAVVGAALLAIGAYRLFRGRTTAQGVRSEAGEASGAEGLQTGQGVGGPDVADGVSPGPEPQRPQVKLADPLQGEGGISGKFNEDRGTHLHQGLDIAVPNGTPVVAAERGVVTHAGWGRGYGRYVEVTHADFGIKTRYAHLSQIAPGIKPEVAVHRGQLLGLSGNTGKSTGPHLHFEVRVIVPGDPRGIPVDPLPYLPPRPYLPLR